MAVAQGEEAARAAWQAAGEELSERVRDLMRADGRVSPRERLWWLVLRHRLQDQHHSPQMRPITGQGQTLADLSLIEKAYVSDADMVVAMGRVLNTRIALPSSSRKFVMLSSKRAWKLPMP